MRGWLIWLVLTFDNRTNRTDAVVVGEEALAHMVTGKETAEDVGVTQTLSQYQPVLHSPCDVIN
jgi:hypothetical protein